MDEAVQVVPCEDAQDLLTKLNPLHDDWKPNPSGWIFRGHGDSTWALLPTANRLKSWEGFRTNYKFLTKRPGDFEKLIPCDGDAERSVLARFFRAIDSAGLPIPGDSATLRNFADDGFKRVEPWTSRDFWALVALAQHHKIPTRLLDWTARAHAAAYFAAKYAAESSTFSGSLDVWCLRADVVRRRCGHQQMVDGLALEIATAPRASNPNLHAQAGLFTVLIGSDVRPLDKYLEEFLRGATNRANWGPNDNPPLLRRLFLSQKEAPRLLRLLAWEGITGATMFPGVAGVVEALREQMLWDEQPDEVHI